MPYRYVVSYGEPGSDPVHRKVEVDQKAEVLRAATEAFKLEAQGVIEVYDDEYGLYTREDNLDLLPDKGKLRLVMPAEKGRHSIGSATTIALDTADTMPVLQTSLSSTSREDISSPVLLTPGNTDTP